MIIQKAEKLITNIYCKKKTEINPVFQKMPFKILLFDIKSLFLAALHIPFATYQATFFT